MSGSSDNIRFVASISQKRSRDEREEEKKEPDKLEEELQEDDSKPSPKLLKSSSGSVSVSSNRLAAARPSAAFRVKKLTSEYSDSRRTNDEIHSSIIFGPVLKSIIDTPQFQRLRGLKQLGTAEFVYCNATHNRFEHSLGVAHLAKLMCEKIRHEQRGLQCTPRDVLCVELAGLFHDGGHGPFSHIFEGFVKQHKEKLQNSNSAYKDLYNNWPNLPPDWGHEHASLMMFNAALAHLGLAVDLQNLDEPLKQIGDGIDARTMRVFEEGVESDIDILTSRDFVFVQECITGEPLPEVERLHGEGFHGRTGEHQEWLYDIVNNRRSSLDVDKIDYYARDQCRALGKPGELDNVMIENAVVAWAKCTEPEGSCGKCRSRKHHSGMHLMICYPEKMLASCADFFKTRRRLHKTIYQHKTTDAVALMIKDIFLKADPYFLVPTSLAGGPSTASVTVSANHDQGQQQLQCDSLPLSRIMMHPTSFLRAKDAIVEQIAMTTDPNLAEARKLVYRLNCRDLYKCVASRTLRCHSEETHRKIWAMKEIEITKAMLTFRGKHGDGEGDDDGDDGDNDGSSNEVTADDFVIYKSDIHHGLKDKNPLIQMRFVEKAKLNKLRSAEYRDLPEAGAVDVDECELHLPPVLQACCLRIYCRDPAKCDLVLHYFNLFWDDGTQEMATTAELDPEEEHRQPAVLSQELSDDEGGNNDHHHDDNGVGDVDGDGSHHFNGNRNIHSPVPNQQADDGTPKSITPVRYKQTDV